MKVSTRNWLVGGCFIVILFIVLFYLGVLGGVGFVSQSVIGAPAKLTLDNGKVYWSATLNVNSINEGLGYTIAGKDTVIVS